MRWAVVGMYPRTRISLEDLQSFAEAMAEVVEITQTAEFTMRKTAMEIQDLCEQIKLVTVNHQEDKLYGEMKRQKVFMPHQSAFRRTHRKQNR